MVEMFLRAQFHRPKAQNDPDKYSLFNLSKLLDSCKQSEKNGTSRVWNDLWNDFVQDSESIVLPLLADEGVLNEVHYSQSLLAD